MVYGPLQRRPTEGRGNMANHVKRALLVQLLRSSSPPSQALETRNGNPQGTACCVALPRHSTTMPRHPALLLASIAHRPLRYLTSYLRAAALVAILGLFAICGCEAWDDGGADSGDAAPATNIDGQGGDPAVTCEKQADCPGTQLCCDLVGAKLCLPLSECPLEAGCGEEAPCDGGELCCDVLGYHVCLDECPL